MNSNHSADPDRSLGTVVVPWHHMTCKMKYNSLCGSSCTSRSANGQTLGTPAHRTRNSFQTQDVSAGTERRLAEAFSSGHCFWSARAASVAALRWCLFYSNVGKRRAPDYSQRTLRRALKALHSAKKGVKKIKSSHKNILH